MNLFKKPTTIIISQVYLDNEIKMVPEPQIKFSIGLELIDKLENLGAIQYEYITEGDKTTVVAKIKVLK